MIVMYEKAYYQEKKCANLEQLEGKGGGGELTREIRIKIELFRSSNILNDEWGLVGQYKLSYIRLTWCTWRKWNMWDIQYKYHISEIALPTKQTLVPKVMDVMGVKLPPPLERIPHISKYNNKSWRLQSTLTLNISGLYRDLLQDLCSNEDSMKY